MQEAIGAECGLFTHKKESKKNCRGHEELGPRTLGLGKLKHVPVSYDFTNLGPFRE